MTAVAAPVPEPLQIDPRYVLQTAKNNVASLTQVVAEGVTNSDQAITDRADRDGTANVGSIDIFYGPEATELRVKEDGVGMTAQRMRKRLGNLGGAPQLGSKRGFFHRGIREVFLAMGGGAVHSVGLDDDGNLVYSCAEVGPEGIKFTNENAPVAYADLSLVGLPNDRTGTVIVVPMGVLATQKPAMYEFSPMSRYIEDCVQIRPVLLDHARTVSLHYANEPPRILRYNYEAADILIDNAPVTIGPLSGTFWVRAAAQPIKSYPGRQLRRNGILVRAERAAYEVTTGVKLRSAPGMSMIIGELRLDDIETLQRKADDAHDLTAQLIYKADRSGLNAENPLVEKIYDFIDTKLATLVEEIERRSPQRSVNPDMRRQLAKLANLINQHIESTETDRRVPGKNEKNDIGNRDRSGPGPLPPPPAPGPPPPRVLTSPMEFAATRALLEAGDERVVQLWVDPKLIPPGTPLRRACHANEIVRSVTVQQIEVPEPDADGVSTVRVNVVAGDSEGRFELAVKAGGAYTATMGVHVRFPRVTGFISNIELNEADWESGGAVYNAKTGRVTVYIGRPEFKDAQRRALRDGVKDPLQHPLYRQLIVESILEAALMEAAARSAELEWDDLPQEDRGDPMTLHNMVLTHFYEFHYKLRHVLHSSFSVAV